MAYQASNHRNNNNGNKPVNNNQQMNRGGNTSKDNSLVNRKGYNGNGYKNVNNYNSKNTNDSQIQNTLQKVKEKQKKTAAKKAIVEGMNALAPGVGGAAAEAALKTKQGDEILDAYAKGDTPAEGIKNVKQVLDRKKRIIKLIGLVLSLLLPILILVILVSVIFKNADSQIFSNENGGTVESDDYGYDNPDTNIFANYPGLYEKIERISQDVSEEYKLEIDKFLIAATLVAPIENGLIIPVNDGSCGEEECYYFNDESLTWDEFLDSWGDQSELLAKMQIMTYVNPASKIKVSCGDEQTMEQYAQNDLEINTFPWYGWLNPLNWFRGFTDAVKAEVNAKCIDVPSGKYKVPTVYTISTEQGEYYLTNDASGNYDYVKDPNSGGVYFWNLINKNGFIHEYLKDYLSAEYKDDPDKNYEINKKTIVETVNYIYSYYESIRKDCLGNKILESEIENINIYNPPEKQSRYGIPENQSINFEDQYIGGVMLAEYNMGDLESMKAFAILARTEAVAIVGLDGSGTIENSSNDQNYSPDYSPEKYPKIAEAVEATRGMVLSKFQDPKVWHTEYDAFCPIKNTLEGGFYYLDDDQQNLPINPSAYEAITGKEFISPNSRWLDCPCFQNSHSRPHDEEADDENTRYHTSSSSPPTYPGGTPSQTTKDVCWTYKGPVTTDDGLNKFAWKYKPSGGHGRGASQYGLKYFEAFGYDRDALLRMFFEGGVVRVLSSSLPERKCADIPYYTGEKKVGGTGTSGST